MTVTHKSKIRASLMNVPGAWVYSQDMSYCSNITARISELRDEGLNIECEECGPGGTRYRVIGECPVRVKPVRKATRDAVVAYLSECTDEEWDSVLFEAALKVKVDA